MCTAHLHTDCSTPMEVEGAGRSMTFPSLGVVLSGGGGGPVQWGEVVLAKGGVALSRGEMDVSPGQP